MVQWARSLDRPTVARVECYDLVLLAEALVLATLFFVVLFLAAVFLVAVFLVAVLAVARRPDVVASERLVLFRVLPPPFDARFAGWTSLFRGLLFDARFAGRTSLFRGLKRSNIF